MKNNYMDTPVNAMSPSMIKFGNYFFQKNLPTNPAPWTVTVFPSRDPICRKAKAASIAFTTPGNNKEW